ncbi:MAG: hypothetical protein MMC33_006804 [Icmadophila ericetorum]|nr:hypothetical protein [Icmadophila ericetorum]
MLLENHLEQISLSAQAIAELPFPPPKIFTNAMIHPHDITTLIRDTEAHERALFTTIPEDRCQSRRRTGFSIKGIHDNELGSLVGRRQTKVEMLLGGDMLGQICRRGAGEGRTEVDVDFLLKGAEKLPIEGAFEKIASFRRRYEQLSPSIAHYEHELAMQTSELGKLKQDDRSEAGDDEYMEKLPIPESGKSIKELLEQEEEELREIEKKKRVLEDRVKGLERDLGGILR